MTKYKVTGPHKIGDTLGESEPIAEMGDMKKLAAGHENLSILIESGIESIARHGAQALNATRPQKKERTTYTVNQGLVFGPRRKVEKELTELDEEEEV